MPQSAAVWSPKGGVGKSLIAVAMALHLAEHQRTVLIDGNADNPDVVSLLQCPGHPNVTGWIENPGPDDLDSLLVRHSNRLWVLPGPPRYVEEAALSGPVMGSALELCRKAGMVAVVDLGSALRDSTVEALDRVDQILMPVTLDLLSLTPIRRLERELELLRVPRDKFRVVINRHTNSWEITVDDVRSLCPFPVAGVIPSARELAAAVNRGEAAVALSGGSPVGRALAGLCAPFLSREAAAADAGARRATGGWLRWRGNQ